MSSIGLPAAPRFQLRLGGMGTSDLPTAFLGHGRSGGWCGQMGQLACTSATCAGEGRRGRTLVSWSRKQKCDWAIGGPEGGKARRTPAGKFKVVPTAGTRRVCPWECEEHEGMRGASYGHLNSGIVL